MPNAVGPVMARVAGVSPVPVNEATVEPPGVPESVMVPARDPSTCGVNVTCRLQLAPPASVAPVMQAPAWLVCEKSERLRAMPSAPVV